MRFKDKEIAPTDTLKLVMNNYRYSGVGGYDMYPACPVIKEILTEIPEIIIDYFLKHPSITVDATNYFDVIAPSNIPSTTK